ncbi:unnamed protein product [Schistosoma margrebowiei]|uniref:Uncharacterized protein n=1 Tax=Schistosoma margrebowiei TaxID=48269 RepID=A0A3P7XAY5_9TREM|nr:unnamed protein product [Schistosoma margrebowiei]
MSSLSNVILCLFNVDIDSINKFTLRHQSIWVENK